MNFQPQRDMLGFIAMALVAASAFYFFTWSPSEKKIVSPISFLQQEKSKPTVGGDCGDLVSQCVAVAETKLTGCIKSEAKAKLGELLAAPLKSPACDDARQKMESQCEPGCQLDFSSILVVPGEIRISTISQPDEFGQCLVRGSRPVSVRGRCQRSG